MGVIKNVTVETLKEIIRDNLERETLGIVYHYEVVNILKKFNGKKPTKHIANEYQKLHPDFTVNWRAEYGMFHLEFWGGDTKRDYQNRHSMLIGYDSNPIVDVDKFQEYDACYGNAAEKRNQVREKMLNDNRSLEQMAEALNEFNRAHEFLKETLSNSIEIPDTYQIEKLAPCYTAYPRR